MTTRPHDALFQSAFEAPSAVAALLRELLPPAVRKAVVWKTLDHERGSFVDVRLAERHSDLLLSAQLRTGEPKLIYFLLEHQSASDPAMPRRTLSYQSRIWDRFARAHRGARLAPVIAVLVSHVPGGWTAARAFEELFDPKVMALAGLGALVPRCTMIVEDLMELSNADLAARSLGAFQKVALWLLRDARDSARLLDSFDAWIPAMLAVRRSRSGEDSFSMLITYMLQVIDPVHEEELHAKIRTLGSWSEEVAMTIAEQLHKQGRKQGREEGLKRGLKRGLKKGREEGRIDTLRSLLMFKFRTLGTQYEARLQAAPPEAIDRYLKRLLTADSLAKVFKD